jgi:hypothetical protein
MRFGCLGRPVNSLDYAEKFIGPWLYQAILPLRIGGQHNRIRGDVS